MTWNELVSGRATPAPPLTDAYRTIRMLDAAEGPVPGVLAQTDAGQVVLVDAEAVVGWAGWSLRGPHVLGPIDVARRADGHDVVVPWCSHRLDDEMRAAWKDGAGLAGGQVVTLAVSLLRGVEDARRGLRGASEGAKGAWWADDEGRPVFAASLPGEVALGEDAAASAARLLTRVAASTGERALRRPLETVLALLEEPRRIAREGGDAEGALFETCAPQPLEFGAVAPDDADDQTDAIADARRAAAPTRRSRRRGESRERVPLDPRALTEAVWNGRLAEAYFDTAHRVREQAARVLRARRAPYLVAAVAAAAVVTAGLLWPAGETSATAGDEAPGSGDVAEPRQGDADASTDPPKAAARRDSEERRSGGADRDGDADGIDSAEESGGDTGDDDEPIGGGTDDDEAAGDTSSDDEHAVADPDARDQSADIAGAALVARAAACVAAGDPVCAGTVETGSSLLREHDVPWAELARGDTALVDDYGDVALITAEPPDAATYYLVLVRHDGRWLLRDAYAAG